MLSDHLAATATAASTDFDELNANSDVETWTMPDLDASTVEQMFLRGASSVAPTSTADSDHEEHSSKSTSVKVHLRTFVCVCVMHLFANSPGDG